MTETVSELVAKLRDHPVLRSVRDGKPDLSAIANYVAENYALRDEAATALASAEARIAELTEATAYAERLAIALHQKHHADLPEWKPLTGDLIGLLTQIDNMTAALARARSLEKQDG